MLLGRSLSNGFSDLAAVKETVGFQHVDAHVTNVMTTWIGKVLEQTCRELLVWHSKLLVGVVENHVCALVCLGEPSTFPQLTPVLWDTV